MAVDSGNIHNFMGKKLDDIDPSTFTSDIQSDSSTAIESDTIPTDSPMHLQSQTGKPTRDVYAYDSSMDCETNVSEVSVSTVITSKKKRKPLAKKNKSKQNKPLASTTDLTMDSQSQTRKPTSEDDTYDSSINWESDVSEDCESSTVVTPKKKRKSLGIKTKWNPDLKRTALIHFKDYIHDRKAPGKKAVMEFINTYNCEKPWTSVKDLIKNSYYFQRKE